MSALESAFGDLFSETVGNAGSWLQIFLPFVGVVLGVAIAGLALGFVVRWFRD